jgi:GNAT superfamily N-acetyltransferase
MATTFALRATTPADIPRLHRLMRDFSVHERAQERFQITEGGLHEALFSPNPAISSVLADSDGMTVGFALWFFFFGTFSGRYGLWVANLYVEERYRGIGIGLALFRHMARIAVDLGAIAEFERGLLLECQREGVAKAKRDGKYKGRKPTARAKAAQVIKLDAEGLQRAEIARRVGIGIASVYRVLASANKKREYQKSAA